MPVTRLFPATTDVSGSGFNTFGVSPAHVGLSDGNDGTGCQQQLSTFEPVRWALGPTITQLPTASGHLQQLTVGFRCGCDNANSLSGFGKVGPNQVNVANVPTSLTTFTGTFAPPATFAAIAAYDWRIQIDFILHDGVLATVTELWLDVEWYPISGFKGMLLGLLGPLVAVGLAEMPAIARDLARRTRTRILPREYEAAWRELREDRRRVYFAL